MLLPGDEGLGDREWGEDGGFEMGLLFTMLGMGFTGDDKGVGGGTTGDDKCLGRDFTGDDKPCNMHLKLIGMGRGITGDDKGREDTLFEVDGCGLELLSSVPEI